MSELSPRREPSRLVAVLGPTNTGKTHLAVERMLGHASGMIGLPLRLLAREIYDRVVKARGARCVALITGEEKIVPPDAALFRLHGRGDAARPRGRVSRGRRNPALRRPRARPRLHPPPAARARARPRPCFMGAATMAPLIRRLCPHAEIQSRERFSQLTYAGPKKLTRLPRAQRRGRLLRRRGLRHRRADPPPARRRGGGDGLALARAPATPRSSCSSPARSTSSSPPTPSAWA